MGLIRVERLPDYDVVLHLYSGAMAGGEVISHFRRLGASDAGRWIHYVEPNADMSCLDVACLPELKRAIADKKHELFGDEPSTSAIVYGSRTNERFFTFWRSYAGYGEPHPRLPVLFTSLEAACEWLRLPRAGRQAVLSAAGVPEAAEAV
jgi:hypothetical protein